MSVPVNKTVVLKVFLNILQVAAVCGAVAACASAPPGGAPTGHAATTPLMRSLQPLRAVNSVSSSPRSDVTQVSPALPALSSLPEFPWPPPAPSEQLLLPDATFRKPGAPAPSLAAVGERIVHALHSADYLEYSFYRAPNGFALVARLERTTPDGTPLPAEFRYIPPDASEPFSLTGYIRSLFFAPEGFYRLIVFVVTDQPFVASETSVDAAGANRLLRNGANRLPEQLSHEVFTPAHVVTVLIYEYRKGHGGSEVAAIVPGRLAAETHLERSQIGRSLQSEP